MMVSIPEWLSVIGLIVTISGLIGTGVFLARGSFDKAKMEALRDDNKDLRDRLGDANGKIAELEEVEHTQGLKLVAAEQRIQLLEALVTQRAEVEAVARAIREHDTAAMDQLRAMTKQLELMVGLLQKQVKPA